LQTEAQNTNDRPQNWDTTTMTGQQLYI